MRKEYITNSSSETQRLGQILAAELLAQETPGAQVLCLEGNLGAGKTTFTQGLLEHLGAAGPYTSPTFIVMKHYESGTHIAHRASRSANQSNTTIHDSSSTICDTRSTIHDIYHIDTYRVAEQDILNLGWEEMLTDPANVIVVEWPERIKQIIPASALRIKFEWLSEEQRKITFAWNKKMKALKIIGLSSALFLLAGCSLVSNSVPAPPTPVPQAEQTPDAGYLQKMVDIKQKAASDVQKATELENERLEKAL